MNGFSIELLTREGCQLCEAAEPVARRVARLVGAQWRTVDVDLDPDTAAAWGARVPVVRTGKGTVLAERRFGPWSLLLAAVRARLAGQ